MEDKMENKLETLLDKIRRLEHELIFEIQKKEDEFFYEIHKKRVRFQRQVKVQHKLLVKTVYRYLRDSRLTTVLTAPVIWSCLIPAVMMDLVVTIYQTICFPVYCIPKVQRGDYIIVDRQYLNYLNFIEKMNCMYCGYFNGVVAYAREVGARTEQHWCPIKHARKMKDIHYRYKSFIDYGDGMAYREKIETVRRDFADLSK